MERKRLAATGATGLLSVRAGEAGQSENEHELEVLRWGAMAWEQGTVWKRGEAMDGEVGGGKLAGTAGGCDELQWCI